MNAKETNELISVVMPVYNSGRFLEIAINSILQQTYPHFELIVIDDGSTDNSRSIVEGFSDERITYMCNEKNSGIVYSLNKAIEASRGKYIARMDGDDISVPERFALQLAAFRQDPELIICGSWYRTIYKGKTLNTVQLPVSSEEIKAALLFANPICHPSVMFRKKVWENTGGYLAKDVNCEDYGLWTRATNMGEFYNIPQYLLHYRLHDKNVSATKTQERIAAEENIKAGSLELQLAPGRDMSRLFATNDKKKLLFLTHQIFVMLRKKTPQYRKKAVSDLFYFLVSQTGILTAILGYKGSNPVFIGKQFVKFAKRKMQNQLTHLRRFVIDKA